MVLWTIIICHGYFIFHNQNISQTFLIYKKAMWILMNQYNSDNMAMNYDKSSLNHSAAIWPENASEEFLLQIQMEKIIFRIGIMYNKLLTSKLN